MGDGVVDGALVELARSLVRAGLWEPQRLLHVHPPWFCIGKHTPRVLLAVRLLSVCSRAPPVPAPALPICPATPASWERGPASSVNACTQLSRGHLVSRDLC